MAQTEIAELRLFNQPKTQFATLVNPIKLNVGAVTSLKLKVTDKGDGKFEIEALA